MKALTFSVFGGPDVLEYIEVADPILQPNTVLVHMKAIGLNYADVYRRKGNYHLKGEPPYIAGYEGAGIVLNANGCAAVKNGDRIFLMAGVSPANIIQFYKQFNLLTFEK